MTSGTPPRMAAWLESAWLARYLDRQLEGEELAWFEAYLLDKPELVEAVEVDEAMRRALVTASGDGAISEQRGGSRRSPNIWRFAAMFVIGAAAGLLANAIPRGSSRQNVWANPTRVVYETMRDVGATRPTVELGASASPYVLVEISIPPDAVDVTLDVDDLRGQRMTVSSDGFVSFLVERAKFTPSTTAVLEYRSGGRVWRRSVQFLDLNGR